MPIKSKQRRASITHLLQQTESEALTAINAGEDAEPWELPLTGGDTKRTAPWKSFEISYKTKQTVLARANGHATEHLPRG